MAIPIVKFGLTFASSLGLTRYIAILPEAYDHPDSQAVRYPVVYCLHGIGGHEDEWLNGSRIAEYAASRETIYIFPNADQLCYVDSHDGSSRCETMMASEMVSHVDRTYRTLPQPDARGLMGLSMGGYGALYLSLRHPDVFGPAVSLSGAFIIGLIRMAERRPERAHVDQLFPVGPLGREQWDLFAQVRAASDEVRESMRWKLLCGVDDRLIDINRALHHYLLAFGLQHDYDEYPGAHTWPFWDEHAVESLDFLDRHLLKAVSEHVGA